MNKILKILQELFFSFFPFLFFHTAEVKSSVICPKENIQLGHTLQQHTCLLISSTYSK